jgi:hypothetical protein
MTPSHKSILATEPPHTVILNEVRDLSGAVNYRDAAAERWFDRLTMTGVS